MGINKKVMPRHYVECDACGKVAHLDEQPDGYATLDEALKALRKSGWSYNSQTNSCLCAQCETRIINNWLASENRGGTE